MSGVVISPPYPNPIQGQGSVKFDVMTSSATNLNWDVFTTASRKIVSGFRSIAGNTTITWNLSDGRGGHVADGLYYLRVKVVMGKTTMVKTFNIVVLR
jgi:hypothetical protein